MLLAEVIEITDKWFDLKNSHQLHQGKPSKSAYDTDLVSQNKILDDMESLIKNIRTLSAHCLPAATNLQVDYCYNFNLRHFIQINLF
jgi:hypothetical protein